MDGICLFSLSSFMRTLGSSTTEEICRRFCFAWTPPQHTYTHTRMHITKKHFRRVSRLKFVRTLQIWTNTMLSMASLVISMQLRWAFNEIRRRILKHRNYLKVLRHMMASYPMASLEELTKNSDDCAICWDLMDTARKLPCGHLFHKYVKGRRTKKQIFSLILAPILHSIWHKYCLRFCLRFRRFEVSLAPLPHPWQKLSHRHTPTDVNSICFCFFLLQCMSAILVRARHLVSNVSDDAAVRGILGGLLRIVELQLAAGGSRCGVRTPPPAAAAVAAKSERTASNEPPVSLRRVEVFQLVAFGVPGGFAFESVASQRSVQRRWRCGESAVESYRKYACMLPLSIFR